MVRKRDRTEARSVTRVSPSATVIKSDRTEARSDHVFVRCSETEQNIDTVDLLTVPLCTHVARLIYIGVIIIFASLPFVRSIRGASLN
jgi:hypothetical protein